ncbi:Pto-interacting protein 1 [Platanthera zijinensis]|uniref:Pto-interacting protein 1 n=1 Tax=Platanthera zijinensis TaxID=2320716 RepID=A0AAP0BS97_9ASPA
MLHTAGGRELFEGLKMTLDLQRRIPGGLILVEDLWGRETNHLSDRTSDFSGESAGGKGTSLWKNNIKIKNPMSCFACCGGEEVHVAPVKGGPFPASQATGNDGSYRTSDHTPKGVQNVKLQPIENHLSDRTSDFSGESAGGKGTSLWKNNIKIKNPMSCFACCGGEEVHVAPVKGGPFPASQATGNDGSYRTSDHTPKGVQNVKLQPIEVPVIPVEEIKDITDNFGNNALIGEGSYGRVYYGILKNGRAAALKKLDASKQPDQEFISQMSSQQWDLFMMFFMGTAFWLAGGLSTWPPPAGPSSPRPPLRHRRLEQGLGLKERSVTAIVASSKARPKREIGHQHRRQACVKGNEVSSWAGEALILHICMEAPLHQRVGEGSSPTG